MSAGAGLVDRQALPLEALRRAGSPAAPLDSRPGSALAKCLARYPTGEALVRPVGGSVKEKECWPATRSCKNKIGLAQLLLTSRSPPARLPPALCILLV